MRRSLPVRLYTDYIRTITTREARRVADIHLPRFCIRHYDRTGAYNAVFGHGAIVRDTTTNTQERAAAHSARPRERNTRGEETIIFDHSVMPDMRGTFDHHVVANTDPIVEQAEFGDKYIFTKFHVVPDERRLADVRNTLEASGLNGGEETPPDAV